MSQRDLPPHVAGTHITEPVVVPEGNKTAFAAPILAGKTDAWKAAIAEILGARKDAYIQARRALGITKEVASLQQTPHGDFAVVYIEASDTSAILQNMIDATDPFHTWFKQAVLKDCHGIDASNVPPTNAVSLDLV